MQCRKLAVSFFIFLASCFVFAQGNIIENDEDKNYSDNQNLDWEKIQLKLGNIKGKLDAQVGHIQTLIEEKTHLKGAALATKMKALREEHLKLETMTSEYNGLNLEYLTKFPERGVKEKRIYKRIKPKSLQSFEDDYTLQGRVNKLHNKILNQYPKTSSEFKKKKNNSKLSPKANPSDQKKNASEDLKKPDEADITEQIILKK